MKPNHYDLLDVLISKFDLGNEWKRVRIKDVLGVSSGMTYYQVQSGLLNLVKDGVLERYIKPNDLDTSAHYRMVKHG